LIFGTVEPPTQPAIVYPNEYRGLLVRAASSDAPIRTVMSGPPEISPEPVLPELSTIELVNERNAAGTYEVVGEGGTDHVRIAGVVENSSVVSPVPVNELPPERAELVRQAAEGGRLTYRAHTEKGTWIRTTFVGGGFVLNGTTYSGIEYQQTDAGINSLDVWYDVDLVPTDDAAPVVTMDLTRLDPVMRGLLNEVSWGYRQGPPSIEVDPLPEQAVRFVEESGLLAMPSAFVRVRME
jgi:hypothetical protein